MSGTTIRTLNIKLVSELVKRFFADFRNSTAAVHLSTDGTTYEVGKVVDSYYAKTCDFPAPAHLKIGDS